MKKHEREGVVDSNAMGTARGINQQPNSNNRLARLLLDPGRESTTSTSSYIPDTQLPDPTKIDDTLNNPQNFWEFHQELAPGT